MQSVIKTASSASRATFRAVPLGSIAETAEPVVATVAIPAVPKSGIFSNQLHFLFIKSCDLMLNVFLKSLQKIFV